MRVSRAKAQQRLEDLGRADPVRREPEMVEQRREGEVGPRQRDDQVGLVAEPQRLDRVARAGAVRGVALRKVQFLRVGHRAIGHGAEDTARGG
jgi:hypothetical protein